MKKFKIIVIGISILLVGCGQDLLDIADKETLKILNEKYAKDKDNVYFTEYRDFYYDTAIIKDANANSFELFQDKKDFAITSEKRLSNETYYENEIYYAKKDYARDKNNVYYFDKKIEESDPVTFELLSMIYAKDKNNVYLNGKIIESLDSNTFEPIQKDSYQSTYFKDKNSVFRYDKRIEEADPNTFEILFYQNKNNTRYLYTKDKNNIYCAGKKIKKADTSSFRVLKDAYAMDQSNCYDYCKIVDMSECKKFEN